jgi:hypothetical protein
MRLLVRLYNSGRIARCLGIGDDGKGRFTHVVSLEKSFQLDGGMDQYEIYDRGNFKNSFVYRELTFLELLTLTIKENTIVTWNKNAIINVNKEVDLLKKEKIVEYRLEKLKKLNSI